MHYNNSNIYDDLKSQLKNGNKPKIEMRWEFSKLFKVNIV